MVACFPRSPQQVTKRLDHLIAQIREIQAPYMYGEKPAEVVLVQPTLLGLYFSISAKLTLNAGRTRSDLARFRQAMAEISPR